MENVNWVRRDHWGAKVFTGPREAFDRELPKICNRGVQISAAREFESTEFKRKKEDRPAQDTKDLRVVVAKRRATGNTRAR